MLRIGDIHIKSDVAKDILEELWTYIWAHKHEQHIVFFGDYVYHFQYDRKVLLALFHFFLSLYTEWKHVYILAGNHDWIHNHFVYEEGQYALAVSGQDTWSIQFITKPTLLTIEWQDCLFYPYTPFLESLSMEWFEELLQSDHQWEQLSWKANADLLYRIQQRRKNKASLPLCVFHHRYVAKTIFPWQKTSFNYKNHALSPAFASMEDVVLVSWHIHHPFVWKKYICLGSVRSVSPLEINQHKFLYTRDVKQQKLFATPIEINPYMRLAATDHVYISQEVLLSERKKQYEASCLYLSSGDIQVICASLPKDPPWKKITLSLEHDTLWYDELETYVEKETSAVLQKIVIKRDKKSYQIDKDEIDTASATLDTSIANWKELLELYITKKRKDDADDYLHVLRELEIIK